MAAAGVSAMATGALAQAANASRTFEEALTDIEMVSTAETARKMGVAIREMAGEIPVAHQELAQITETAARLGIEGTDNLESFTRVTAEMAASTDLAANDAADAFARMSTLMNEPITNIRSLGDAVNILGNTMATSASEITNSATRSAGVLTQLGLTSQEILGLNAAMNEVSASSRIAGTQLRRFGQEIMNPRKVSDLAAALGMTSDEFIAMRTNSPNDLIIRMAEAFRRGGEEAEAMRGVLGTTSRQTLAGLAQNLDSVREAQGRANQQFAEGGSLAKEFQTSMQTFNSSAQVFRNNVQNLAIEIGDVLLPYMSRLIDAVNDYLSSSDSLINRLTAQQKAFGLVGTAVGTAGVALLAFAGGPITAAIAAVGALSAAFATNFAGIRSSAEVVLSQLSTEFRETFALIQRLTETDLTAITGIFGTESRNWENIIGEALGRLTTRIQEGLMRAGDAVRAGIRLIDALWEAHGDDVVRTVRTSYDAVSGVATTGITQARETVDRLTAGIEAVWAEHGNRVELAVTSTYNSISGHVSSGLTLARETIARLTGEIETLWNQHGGRVEQAVSGAYDTVRTTLSGAAERAKPLINTALGEIEGLWTTHGTTVRESVSGAYDTVKSTLSDAVTEAKPLVNTALGELEGFWNTHKETVSNTVGELKTGVMDSFRTLKESISAFADGEWKKGFDKLWDAVNGVMGEIQTLLVGEGGDGGVIITSIKGIGKWLENNVGDIIGGGFELLSDVASDKISSLRMYLVGEDGNSGIINTMVDEATDILNANAGTIWADAWENLNTVAQSAMGDLKIALIGESGSGGIINNLIGSIGSFLSGGGRDIVYEGWKDIGAGVRTAADELLKAVIDSDDSIIRKMIGNIGSYLKDDAWGDIQSGWDKLDGLWMAAWEGFVDGVMSDEDSLVVQLIRDVQKFLRDDAASKLATATKDGVIDAMKKAWEDFKEWLIGGSFVQEMFGDVAEWIEIRGKFLLNEATGVVISEIRSAWEDFKSWIWNTFFPETFQNVKKWLESTGADVMDTAFGQVVDAIESALGEIDLSDIFQVIEDIISTAEDALEAIEAIPNNVSVNIDWPTPPRWFRRRFMNGGDGGDGGDEGDDGGGGGGSRGGRGAGGADDSSNIGSGDGSGGFVGLQHGGITRGAGMAYLHPNEVVMGEQTGAKALVEEMADLLGGDGMGGPQLVMSEGAIQVEGGDPEQTADAVLNELEREIDRLLGR